MDDWKWKELAKNQIYLNYHAKLACNTGVYNCHLYVFIHIVSEHSTPSD